MDSMPNFSFMEGVILTIPGGVVGELRNKTKLQPKLVEVELWLSLVISLYFPHDMDLHTWNHLTDTTVPSSEKMIS